MKYDLEFNFSLPPFYLQIFLPSSLCVSYGQWLEEKKRANGKRWLFGTRVTTLCIYWNRK